jgi:hypothetical protein
MAAKRPTPPSLFGSSEKYAELPSIVSGNAMRGMPFGLGRMPQRHRKYAATPLKPSQVHDFKRFPDLEQEGMFLKEGNDWKRLLPRSNPIRRWADSNFVVFLQKRPQQP